MVALHTLSPEIIPPPWHSKVWEITRTLREEQDGDEYYEYWVCDYCGEDYEDTEFHTECATDNIIGSDGNPWEHRAHRCRCVDCASHHYYIDDTVSPSTFNERLALRCVPCRPGGIHG